MSDTYLHVLGKKLGPDVWCIATIIGASVNEPHTSELNRNFSYNIICCMSFCMFLTLQFNAIAAGRMWTVSKIFVQLGSS